LHVAPGIIALERQRRQRAAAGHLEHRAEQDRFPSNAAAVLRSDRRNPRRAEIAVRRREVEIELDRIGHGVSLSVGAKSRSLQRLGESQEQNSFTTKSAKEN